MEKSKREKIQERIDKIDYHQSVLSQEVEELKWDFIDYFKEHTGEIYYEESVMVMNGKPLYLRKQK